MIKAKIRLPNGDPLIVLGLSGENLTRLVAGEPILIKLADVAMGKGHAVIMYGKTEQAITAELEARGLIPPGMADVINARD